MFGLSFVQTGFLFAGLAAAIPIAIHLLLKQRARRVDIGSVRFLQIVLKEHNRMHRIREWMLLAARIITAFLLALLFARPFFDQTAVEAGQREVIYLLDRSASMQVEKSGETLFASAYETLKSELSGVHSETIVRVATFDSEGVTPFDWKAAAEQPQPSFAGTDYAKALAWASNVLQQSTRQQLEVVVFTDLQRAGLTQSQLGEFPANIDVSIRDFGKAIANNQSISAAVATAVEIRPEMPPTIEVDVRNGSPISVEDVELSLTLSAPDGSEFKASQSISVAGGDVRTAVFKITPAVEGIYSGRVTLASADDLSIDNQRFVTMEARRPDRILLVDGEEGSSIYGDETYYLQTAMRVGGARSDREIPSYEVERIVWDNGKGFPDLNGFRAVVLANVGSFTGEDALRLKVYLEQSAGRVIFFCGDKFSRRATRSLASAGILPGGIEGTASAGPYRFASWDKTHPVFGPFADPQYGDLRSIRFSKLALLGSGKDSESQQASRASVLATSGTGVPILVEHEFGDKKNPGKVIVWASTADAQWSTLPQGRLFVPIVRQLLAYATDHHSRAQKIREVIATDQPGIRAEGDSMIVANMDPLESDLTRTTAEAFRKTLKLPETKAMADLSPSELAALAPPKGSQRPEEIWQTVAWILLGWLLVETFLAGKVHA